MKRIKINQLALMIAIIINTGCSSDNNGTDSNEEEILNNKAWVYISKYWHDTSSLAKDKNKTYPKVNERAAALRDLEYTDNVNEEHQSLDWDLCERSNHECDTTISALFTSGKCLFNVNIGKMHYKADKVTTEKSYKFKEGRFIAYVNGSYHGIYVYNYAIYMCEEGGDVLYLPLDGNYCAVYESNVVYKDKRRYKETIKEYSVTTKYTVSGNKITSRI